MPIELAFITDAAFEQSPQHLAESKLEDNAQQKKLPANWFKLLFNELYNKAEAKQLIIGPKKRAILNASIIQNPQAIKHLKDIYQALKRYQSLGLKTKQDYIWHRLVERVEHCADGFAIGLGLVSANVKQVDNLHDLLQRYRQELVDVSFIRVKQSYHTAIENSNEVHLLNDVNRVAVTLKLGVDLLHENDTFCRVVPDYFIEKCLRDVFSEEYHPLFILNHCLQYLLLEFRAAGYIGQLIDCSYEALQYEAWLDLTKKLLGVPDDHKYELLSVNDDGFVTGINEQKLLAYAKSALTKHGIQFNLDSTDWSNYLRTDMGRKQNLLYFILSDDCHPLIQQEILDKLQQYQFFVHDTLNKDAQLFLQVVAANNEQLNNLLYGTTIQLQQLCSTFNDEKIDENKVQTVISSRIEYADKPALFYVIAALKRADHLAILKKLINEYRGKLSFLLEAARLSSLKQVKALVFTHYMTKLSDDDRFQQLLSFEQQDDSVSLLELACVSPSLFNEEVRWLLTEDVERQFMYLSLVSEYRKDYYTPLSKLALAIEEESLHAFCNLLKAVLQDSVNLLSKVGAKNLHGSLFVLMFAKKPSLAMRFLANIADTDVVRKQLLSAVKATLDIDDGNGIWAYSLLHLCLQKANAQDVTSLVNFICTHYQAENLPVELMIYMLSPDSPRRLSTQMLQVFVRSPIANIKAFIEAMELQNKHDILDDCMMDGDNPFVFLLQQGAVAAFVTVYEYILRRDQAKCVHYLLECIQHYSSSLLVSLAQVQPELLPSILQLALSKLSVKYVRSLIFNIQRLGERTNRDCMFDYMNKNNATTPAVWAEIFQLIFHHFNSSEIFQVKRSKRFGNDSHKNRFQQIVIGTWPALNDEQRLNAFITATPSVQAFLLEHCYDYELLKKQAVCTGLLLQPAKYNTAGELTKKLVSDKKVDLSKLIRALNKICANKSADSKEEEHLMPSEANTRPRAASFSFSC